MKIDFDRKFEKDFDKLPTEIQNLVKNVIRVSDTAQLLSYLPNFKKLKNYKNYYRIKIGNYRIGLYIDSNDSLIFSRVLHRREIYRYFPKK